MTEELYKRVVTGQEDVTYWKSDKHKEFFEYWAKRYIAIPTFIASRGTWRLSGTISTGRYTCRDEYRLMGTAEFLSVDRYKLYRMIDEGKVSLPNKIDGVKGSINTTMQLKLN